jgi:hypothetical protein
VGFSCDGTRLLAGNLDRWHALSLESGELVSEIISTCESLRPPPRPTGDQLSAIERASGHSLRSPESAWEVAMAPSPDGRLLVIAARGTVELWQLEPVTLVTRLVLLRTPPGAVAIAPDGRYELLGSGLAEAPSLRCQVGGWVLPMRACSERLYTPGILRRRLATIRTRRSN